MQKQKARVCSDYFHIAAGVEEGREGGRGEERGEERGKGITRKGRRGRNGSVNFEGPELQKRVVSMVIMYCACTCTQYGHIGRDDLQVHLIVTSFSPHHSTLHGYITPSPPHCLYTS